MTDATAPEPAFTPNDAAFMDASANDTASAIGDGQWHRLPEQVRTLWMTRQCLTTGAFLAACVAAAIACWHWQWWTWQPYAIAILAAISAIDLLTQPLQTRYEYAFHQFLIDQHDMQLSKGWLWRTTTTIPFTRVQHVDTQQGPLLRHFGMTEVVIHTASGEHSIAALSNRDAQATVHLITARVLSTKDDM